MKKSEAEPAIRSLALDWAWDKFGGGPPYPIEVHPSWSEFKEWLSGRGQAHFLAFRSTTSTDADAERWFADVLGQGCRG